MYTYTGIIIKIFRWFTSQNCKTKTIKKNEA